MDEPDVGRGRIVVGVDGSPVARLATLWAAREARLRHEELIITHVSPAMGDPGAPQSPSSGSSGVHALLEASSAASRREPSLAVGTLVLRGPISDELIRLSRTATLLVVGVDQDRPRPSHGLVGPLEDRVVVHAACPVVTVSQNTRSPEPSHHQVVVGWTPNRSGRRALSAAAAEAHTRGAALTIVWALPRIRSQPDLPDRNQTRERSLIPAIAAAQEAHPGLQIDVVETRSEVTDALTRHSLTADLLVIGCHHTTDQWSTRTGPVAQAMMRDGPCPVMLVGRLAAHRHHKQVAHRQGITQTR